MADSDSLIIGLQGTSMGKMSTSRIVRNHMLFSLLWRIAEYIALWIAVYNYNEDDVNRQYDILLDQIDAYKNAKLNTLVDCIYCAVVINAINTFILIAALIYYFLIKETEIDKAVLFGGESAFTYILRDIRIKSKKIKPN